MDKLPPELIDLIVVDYILVDNRFPAEDILPILPICRTWRARIERKLYSRITLTLSNERGKESYRLLCRTLDDVPRLASYVTTLNVEFNSAMKTVEANLDIIGKCSALCHFVFWGYMPYDLRIPTDNISRLNLETLDITWHRHGDRYPTAEIEQIVRLMQCWPKIEKVYIKKYNPGDDDFPLETHPIFGSESISASPLTYLPLRELTLDKACVMTASGFRALQALSLPQLETFHAHLSEEDGVDGALIECLGPWASHLTRLDLDRESFRIYDWPWKKQFSETMKQFTSLKNIEISARMLGPSDLLSIPTLVRIVYWNVDEMAFDDLMEGLEEQTPGSSEKERRWANVPDLESISLTARMDAAGPKRFEAIRGKRNLSSLFHPIL